MCCESGDYAEVADIIRCYIENTDNTEVKQVGMNGRKYLEEKLARDVSVEWYVEKMFEL